MSRNILPATFELEVLEHGNVEGGGVEIVEGENVEGQMGEGVCQLSQTGRIWEYCWPAGAAQVSFLALRVHEHTCAVVTVITVVECHVKHEVSRSKVGRCPGHV